MGRQIMNIRGVVCPGVVYVALLAPPAPLVPRGTLSGARGWSPWDKWRQEVLLAGSIISGVLSKQTE